MTPPAGAPPAAPVTARADTARADTACAAAVELARQAAVEDAGGEEPVGEHVGQQVEGDRVVTHLFEARLPGYVGWRWAVTVARASRAKTVTVDEVCLLPGPDSVLAPAWVPWSQRLQAGDLGAGDLLPAAPDDPRLVPGYAATDDDAGQVAVVVAELGLGRARVLSMDGALDAADRWVNGAGGPEAAIAEQAPARCLSCGFLVRIGGLLGQAFGLCANEYSPDDGRVVALDHGCGAHSEAAAAASRSRRSALSAPVVDEVGWDDLGHA